MSYDFFPIAKYTNKGKITLPKLKTIMEIKEIDYKEEKKKEKIEIEIDEDKLSEKIKKKGPYYNIEELKDIAKKLNIENYFKMNRKDLVKFIKLKISE